MVNLVERSYHVDIPEIAETLVVDQGRGDLNIYVSCMPSIGWFIIDTIPWSQLDILATTVLVVEVGVNVS